VAASFDSAIVASACALVCAWKREQKEAVWSLLCAAHFKVEHVIGLEVFVGADVNVGAGVGVGVGVGSAYGRGYGWVWVWLWMWKGGFNIGCPVAMLLWYAQSP
jgi:hypothetical protein